MSLVKANTYQDASGGSNAVFSGVASPPNSMGFRNRIINGNMVIDQRNAGASVSISNGTTTYLTDRWQVFENGSMAFSGQQVSTAPAGFNRSLLITTTTAAAAGSADRCALTQIIEGFNIADFGWGAAGASAITLSFWVRSSLTGQFGGALQNSAQDYSYPFSFTISAANTFEFKTVTIAGPTTGTWSTDNTGGVRVSFDLGMGSTLLGTAGAWAAADYRGATGDVKLSGTNGATFYITGVQLEAGTNASAFEQIDYGRELILCQRYYYKIGPGITNSMLGVGWNASTTQSVALTTFPVTMRAAPSALEQTGTAGDYSIFSGGGSGTACSSVPSFGIANTTNARTLLTVASGLTANGGSMARAETTNGYFAWSAEL
jgi:hypothetical protein